MPKKQASIKRVTATEFSKNFGAYRDHALREPVAVTNHGRAVTYHISAADFEELQMLRRTSRRAMRTVDLPKETIDAIRNARVPRKYDHLNALLAED